MSDLKNLINYLTNNHDFFKRLNEVQKNFFLFFLLNETSKIS